MELELSLDIRAIAPTATPGNVPSVPLFPPKPITLEPEKRGCKDRCLAICTRWLSWLLSNPKGVCVERQRSLQKCADLVGKWINSIQTCPETEKPFLNVTENALQSSEPTIAKLETEESALSDRVFKLEHGCLGIKKSKVLLYVIQSATALSILAFLGGTIAVYLYRDVVDYSQTEANAYKCMWGLSALSVTLKNRVIMLEQAKKDLKTEVSDQVNEARAFKETVRRVIAYQHMARRIPTPQDDPKKQIKQTVALLNDAATGLVKLTGENVDKITTSLLLLLSAGNLVRQPFDMACACVQPASLQEEESLLSLPPPYPLDGVAKPLLSEQRSVSADPGPILTLIRALPRSTYLIEESPVKSSPARTQVDALSAMGITLKTIWLNNQPHLRKEKDHVPVPPAYAYPD